MPAGEVGLPSIEQMLEPRFGASSPFALRYQQDQQVRDYSSEC